MRAGVDCPAHATFLPALVNDDRGGPQKIPNAICVFERYIGDPAWPHFSVMLGAVGRATAVENGGLLCTRLIETHR